MLTYRDYDKDELKDRVWYQSSNIVYSECYDKPNSLKELTVVFKNGATYKYKDVDVNDYVMFVHGGLDGSNGKALNKYIKAKCPCERLEKTDLELLEKLKAEIIKKRQAETQTTEKTEN